MQRNLANKLLLGYYVATLAFAALDAGWHVNVRLAFLDGAPGWRAVYYAVCIGCAGMMLWRPDLSVLVGGVEGIVTLTALILNLATRSMMIAGDAFRPVTIEEVVNFLIAGTFAYVAWSRGIAALRRHA
jgi:hypothetical protein